MFWWTCCTLSYVVNILLLWATQKLTLLGLKLTFIICIPPFSYPQRWLWSGTPPPWFWTAALWALHSAPCPLWRPHGCFHARGLWEVPQTQTLRKQMHPRPPLWLSARKHPWQYSRQPQQPEHAGCHDRTRWGSYCSPVVPNNGEPDVATPLSPEHASRPTKHPGDEAQLLTGWRRGVQGRGRGRWFDDGCWSHQQPAPHAPPSDAPRHIRDGPHCPPYTVKWLLIYCRITCTLRIIIT